MIMNQNQEKITVIVPCYNVENYLGRCLDSLVDQTYENLEVIMVEDCSTDGTRGVVKEYEKHDNFKAIYNKENGGLGHARNVGIEATTSKYIAFLDSDDWLPANYFETMYTALIDADADLSVCDVFLRYDDPAKDQRIISYNGKPDKLGLINTGLAATSSAKLFKTELFHSLKYPEGIVNEDIPVILTLLMTKKVTYTDKTFFNYYQRTGSIQNGKVTKKRLDIFQALDLLKRNLDGKIDKKLWDAVVWQQIFAVYLYVFPRADGAIRRDLIKEFYEAAKKHNIIISVSNPGFKTFVKNNRVDRYYGPRAVKYLDAQQFWRVSALMRSYAIAQANMKTLRKVSRAGRIVKLAAYHPVQFTNRLKTKLMQKHVIKNNVEMRDLVAAARKQSLISDKSMAVSAIIPNYNYERYLLQRVYSILSQQRKIGEIIILDDKSSDDSVMLAKKIQKSLKNYVSITLINNKVNRGTFAQWELGVDTAKYEYIWIAEADDYCSDKFLTNVLKPLDENSNVVISYANTGYVNDKGLLMGDVKQDIDYLKTGHWNQDYVNNGLSEAKTYSYVNNTIANVSSVVFRKRDDIAYAELFEKAREYRQAGDWVFYVNYMVYGDVAYTDKVLNYYRIHGNNVSSTTKATDHINEILNIQDYFTKKLDLDKHQRQKMAERIKMLKRAWKVS